MEVVSVNGLTSSVISIVDAVAKSIKLLRRLQVQWQLAEWTITCLLRQLNTLKLALIEITDWLSLDLAAESQHGLLAEELCISLDCCRTLVLFLDSHLSQLERNEVNTLTFESKMRAILNDSSVKDCVTQLNNQSHALNLLLTALNCRSISDQKALLQQEKSKDILNKVKDDSSSLICQRDTSSSITRQGSRASHYTETTSLVRREFDFDYDIQTSKVYQVHFRSLLRRNIRKWKPRSQRSRDILELSIRNQDLLTEMNLSSFTSIQELSELPFATYPTYLSKSLPVLRFDSAAEVPTHQGLLVSKVRPHVRLEIPRNIEDRPLNAHTTGLDDTSRTFDLSLGKMPDDRMVDLHERDGSGITHTVSPVPPLLEDGSNGQTVEGQLHDDLDSSDSDDSDCSLTPTNNRSKRLSWGSISRDTTSQRSSTHNLEVTTVLSSDTFETSDVESYQTEESEIPEMCDSETAVLGSEKRGWITSIQPTLEPISCLTPANWETPKDAEPSITTSSNIHRTAATRINHMQVETKSLTCYFCYQSFTFLDHLRDHLLDYLLRNLDHVHTTTEIFKCDFCDQSYTNIDNLRQHIRYCNVDESKDDSIQAESDIESTPALRALLLADTVKSATNTDLQCF